MDALTTAFNNVERSYRTAKASSSALTSELLARGPSKSIVHKSEFSHAKEQLSYYRGWVYACVRAIGQTIAGQELKVGRTPSKSRTRSKSHLQAEELDDHELLALLHRPNDLMTSAGLIYSTVASLELTGRSLWYIDDSDGRDCIFPIPTHWIVKIGGNANYETFHLRPPGYAGEPVRIPGQQCVYFHYPHPGDPRGAYSPLQGAAMSVLSDESIEHSQRASFEQGINPKHALMIARITGPDGKPTAARHELTGSQKNQLVQSLRKAYAGTGKHGDPLILDGLIDRIEVLSRTPTEMDYTGSANGIKERICQAFGVNPIILGEIEGANRASALEAESHFCKHTINPKITLLNEVMTTAFSRAYDGIVVWMDHCVPHDVEAELRRYELVARNGVATPNELRALAGLSAIELSEFDSISWNVSDEVKQAVRRCC